MGRVVAIFLCSACSERGDKDMDSRLGLKRSWCSTLCVNYIKKREFNGDLIACLSGSVFFNFPKRCPNALNSDLPDRTAAGALCSLGVFIARRRTFKNGNKVHRSTD